MTLYAVEGSRKCAYIRIIFMSSYLWNYSLEISITTKIYIGFPIILENHSAHYLNQFIFTYFGKIIWSNSEKRIVNKVAWIITQSLARCLSALSAVKRIASTSAQSMFAYGNDVSTFIKNWTHRFKQKSWRCRQLYSENDECPKFWAKHWGNIGTGTFA